MSKSIMRTYLLIILGLVLIPACAILPGVKQTPVQQATANLKTPTPAPTSQPTPTETHVRPTGKPTPGFAHLRMFREGTGWAVGAAPEAASQIFHTHDSGVTWEVAGPSQAEAVPEGYHAQAFFLDSQHAWVTYYPPDLPALGPSSVWHTADGGASWIPGFTPPVNPDIPDYAFEGLYFTDPQNGWLMLAHSPGAGNAPISIFGSQDAGIHWEIFLDPFEGGADRLHTCCRAGMLFLDTSNGMVAYGGGPYTAPILHTTRDGGRTWSSQELPSADPQMFARAVCASGSLSPLGEGSVALAVWCYDSERPAPIPIPFLYISHDAGASWETSALPDEIVQSAPLRNYRRSYRLHFLDAQYGWFFVEDEDWSQGDPPVVKTHIYQTVDGGLNWNKKSLVDWIGEFGFVDSLEGWAITRQGNMLGLLHTMDGGGTWLSLNPVLQP